RQQASWIKRGLTNLKVAVNISPLEFTRADIVERILQPIRTHQLPPGSNEIEITEHMLMDDAETVIAKVQELRTHGLRISIDDFGTRFSSLTYLRRFPV
ncbi:EAL domain-containing protein, partial [Aromatoleum toluclasticum]|uniref:EAL domain-containing protein n=1 Tax=Aromatoleum toluclasticum TaxID=92003 RepID=UPI001D193DD5